MIVRDLTQTFVETMIHRNDIWEYESSYPELFEHYLRYWCPQTASYSGLTERAVIERAAMLGRMLEQLRSSLQDFGFDVRHLEVVLFVGRNTSNGHAFQDHGRFVVWLPVETYATERRARVFLAHELFHALHYACSPAFCFENETERLHLGRQLITEGLATYATVELLRLSEQEALWADYLSPESWQRWISGCREQSHSLSCLCRDHFDRAWGGEMFMANDSKDLTRFRAGYYVGLSLVRRIARERGYSLRELLSLGRKEFEHLAIAGLSTDFASIS